MAHYNKYQRLKQQYSDDGGVTWYDVDPPVYEKGNLIEEDSPDCMTIEWIDLSDSWICLQDNRMTRFIIDDGNYICEDFNKYYRMKQQESFNSGITWTDVNPPVYMKGNLIEQQSTDCGYSPTKYYRWVDVANEYICEEYYKYKKQKRQWSYDTINWFDTDPLETQKGDFIEAYSTDCGWEPVEPLYRWREVEGEYICNGTTKYRKLRKQVSYDNGDTWSWVVPWEDMQGEAIEYQSTDCGYVPPTPPTPSTDYLTFVALEDGTFKLSRNAIQYSLDNGSTWTTLAANRNSPIITAGSKILWKAELTSYYGVGTFSSSGRFNVEGNVMSMLYGDNFRGQSDLTGKDYAFYYLFNNCTKLVNAENLSLPATTLAERCYEYMFYNCSSLTTAPAILPATTLSNHCYSGMFEHCASLTTAPALPATTLVEYCYIYMFAECTSLTEAPELPATTLVEYCYMCMFHNCSSLTTAPELPATTLAERCYESMFEDCTSLTTAPALPATTLANQCYISMFYGCTSLTTAPELPATTLANQCYGYMFEDCPSLTTAPELPATTLADSCYMDMFGACTSLTTAPELPATTLAESCYWGMFHGCTSLTTAPELPATTLTNGCYQSMFRGCSSLNYIKCLATNISASLCTDDWVNGVAPTGTFVKAANMTSWTTGSDGIPSGWSVQNA